MLDFPRVNTENPKQIKGDDPRCGSWSVRY